MRSFVKIFACLALLAFSDARSDDGTSNQKPMETLNNPAIEFIAEQDGDFERKVKEALAPALKKHKEIKRAYLVAVLYSQREQGVALCLEALPGSEKEIAKDISIVFSRVAGTNLNLDIVFLTTEQQQKVREVAGAFYVAS
jgi:hypothetical protein